MSEHPRSGGDHRVRIYPGGLSSTHCLDCRQDLRDKRHRPASGVILHADGLLSKWGFGDGDAPDHYLDWLDDQHLPYPEDWHAVLRHLVRTRLLPLIVEDIEVYDIATNHNPIRASKVNGVEIDDFADNDNVLRDLAVNITFSAVYDTQQLFTGIPAEAS